MKLFNSAILFSLALTLVGCNSNSSSVLTINSAEAESSPVVGGSGAITASNVAATSLTLNWTASTDSITAHSDLEYMVYQSSSNNISTATDAQANGTPIGSYVANVITLDITGLSQYTTYYFNVLVKDVAGNKTAYSSLVVLTIRSFWTSQLGNESETDYPSIIDSTTGYDECNSVASDTDGNVYCAGFTEGSLGEADGGGANGDAFIMKTNSSGIIQWLTQLGSVTQVSSSAVNSSADLDSCHGVSVDSSGNVYCAGDTISDLGETNGGVSDAFVMKLNSSGEILWLTHLGTATESSSSAVNNSAGLDKCNGVSVDSSGNVYCAGVTSGDFGETNGGGYDAFVMKLNSAGVVQWLTHLGATTQTNSSLVADTSGNDYCDAVSVDSTGNVYCAGYTNGALGETNGGGGKNDAFVMKLDSTGAIQWLTQLGATTQASSSAINDTSNVDTFMDISVDTSGNVFCAGKTKSSLAAGETNGGIQDAFVAKFDSSGVVQWITQLGATTQSSSSLVNDTTASEFCSGITLDSSGNIYCAGMTKSSLAAGETNGGLGDAFVMKLNSSGDIVWLTQLGETTQTSSSFVVDSSGTDRCEGVSVDNIGNVYCAGSSTGSLGETIGGGAGDAFVMKLDSNGNIY
jgi:hypothetical protein